MRRRLPLLAAAAAATLATASPALAWGKDGHAAIADIAEATLDPVALAEIRRLLATEGDSHLSDVSSWADEAGQRVPGSPIHTTRIPIDGTPAPDHACPSGGLCADEAIAQYRVILADRGQPDAAREEALKYIVHLVGDLHQPLHGSDPIGYNMVKEGLAVVNIHFVWDKSIIKDHGVAPDALAQELLGNGIAVQTGGTPRQWAQESSAIARDHIYDLLPPCYTTRTPICPALAVLPAGYTTDKYPLVAQRLKQAGLRLAELLNQLLG